MTNLFISWAQHRAMVIWWRDPFSFELDDYDMLAALKARMSFGEDAREQL